MRHSTTSPTTTGPARPTSAARGRKLLALLAVPFVLVLAMAGPASAADTATNDLAKLWTTVLETPSPQNPFGSGGPATQCISIGGGTIAPFGPNGVASCTITAGTTLFVVGHSVECSTFPNDAPTYASNKGLLGDCAASYDTPAPSSITVDGTAVPITEAETGFLHIVLPADNILGEPAGMQGYSRGHGWVSVVSPLAVGTHTVRFTINGDVLTTTIYVTAG